MAGWTSWTYVVVSGRDLFVERGIATNPEDLRTRYSNLNAEDKKDLLCGTAVASWRQRLLLKNSDGRRTTRARMNKAMLIGHAASVHKTRGPRGPVAIAPALRAK